MDQNENKISADYLKSLKDKAEYKCNIFIYIKLSLVNKKNPFLRDRIFYLQGDLSRSGCFARRGMWPFRRPLNTSLYNVRYCCWNLQEKFLK